MEDNNSNGLDETQFNAAELTLSKYKKEIEDEKVISSELRAKVMQLEMNELTYKKEIESLQQRLKYAEQALQNHPQFKTEREEEGELEIVITPVENISI